MPKIDTLISNRKTAFKKRDYRPWDPKGDHTNDGTSSSLSTSLNDHIYNDVVHSVDPLSIINWEYHDRPENELGDLESLANEFKTIGQQQPCIVRLYTGNENYKYELIVGERRWRAAQIAGTQLRIIVKELSDSDSALIQASENLNRKDLSDYARGISYSNLIENGVIEQKELVDSLKLSKQMISSLLSFSKIPKEIILEIGDMSKVSSRTAEKIKQLSNKGHNYILALLTFADRIREGKLGHEKLAELVESTVSQPALAKHDRVQSNYKYFFNDSNKRIFTLSPKKNNTGLSIHFSKVTSDLFCNEIINYEELSELIKEYINDKVPK